MRIKEVKLRTDDHSPKLEADYNEGAIFIIRYD